MAKKGRMYEFVLWISGFSSFSKVLTHEEEEEEAKKKKKKRGTLHKNLLLKDALLHLGPVYDYAPFLRHHHHHHRFSVTLICVFLRAIEAYLSKGYGHPPHKRFCFCFHFRRSMRGSCE